MRAILTSPTYRGEHVCGKRDKHTAPVDRAVPALVAEPTWQAAQATLARNFRFGRRNAKRATTCCTG